ncbi:DUF4347 domain-containing protein [Malaciobacter sp. WC5094]
MKRNPLISVLEPRVLFDGAAVATAVDVLDNNSFENNETQDSTTTTFESKQIAFIDNDVKNKEKIVEQLDDNIEVYYLDDKSDALKQIQNILEDKKDIDTLHIISHGKQGEILFSNGSLNTQNLDTHKQDLENISKSLSKEADILLYGCSIGQNNQGKEFVDKLASLTSADIAASNDLTGNKILQGDWSLEYESGEIQSESISVDNYETLLANNAPFLSTSSNIDSIPASDFSKGIAQNAFDGDLNTSYFFQPGAGSNFSFDAGGFFIVDSISIITSNGPIDHDPTRFAIYGSNDNTSFSLIASGDLNPPLDRQEASVKTQFTNSEVYRYYRVEFNSLRGSGLSLPVEVAEIKIGGSDITTFSYTEGGTPSQLTNLVILNDDGTTLESAEIAISSGLTTGDILSFTNDDNTLYGSISSSYNSNTGILSLNGTATIEQYKNALKAIRFYSTNDSPETLFNQRTLSWKVNDGVNDSNISKTVLEVVGVNDAPVIDSADALENLKEDGVTSVSGDINASDKDLNDTLSASYTSNTIQAYQSDGSTPLVLSASQRNEIINAFNFTNSTGTANSETFNWSYSISNNNLNFLAKGESIIAQFTIQVTDNNGASVNQVITINIEGTNDEPSVNASSVTGEVVDKGVLTQNGVINFVDPDTTDTPTASLAGTSINGYSLNSQEEQAIINAFSITSASSNTNLGSVNWDFTINQNDIAFLAQGEVITAVFTIEINDGNGSVKQQNITISIKGTNDQPQIQVVDDNGRISEGSSLSDSGSIKFTDIDKTNRPVASETLSSISSVDVNGNPISISASNQTILENAFSITNLNPNSNNADVQWNYSLSENQLDFLSQGDEITLTFTIKVTDETGASSSHDITILIVGENDVPLISVVDVDGQIQEGTTLNDSGSINFTDIDEDDKPIGTFSVKDINATKSDNSALTLSATQRQAIENAFSISNLSSNTNNGTITWDYTISENDINFLAKSETIKAVFTITITDNQGQTSTQDVEITITGSNDNPEITGSQTTGNIQESSIYTDTGTLNFNDLDLTNNISISDYFDSVTAYRADGVTTFSLTTQQQIDLLNAFSVTNTGEGRNSGTITWQYTISEDKLDFLGENESVRIVYNIEVSDNENQKDIQAITINIGGQNDAPIVSNENIDSIITYGQPYTQEIAFLFTDVDNNDNLVYEATGLPTGITFDRISGLISGNPLEIGVFEVTIITYDSSSLKALASRTYQIDVLGPPKVIEPTFEKPREIENPTVVENIEVADNSQRVEEVGVIKDNPFTDNQSKDRFNQDFQKLDSTGKGYTDFQTIDETQAFTSENNFNILRSIEITLDIRGETNFASQQKEAYDTLGLSIEDFTYVNNYLELKIVDIKQARVYEVLLGNGEKLPSTIVFDEKSGVLKGALTDNMEFIIKAYDFDNKIRILNIKIDVSALKDKPIEITLNEQDTGFSSQLAKQSNEIESYGKKISQLFNSEDV